MSLTVSALKTDGHLASYTLLHLTGSLKGRCPAPTVRGGHSRGSRPWRLHGTQRSPALPVQRLLVNVLFLFHSSNENQFYLIIIMEVQWRVWSFVIKSFKYEWGWKWSCTNVLLAVSVGLVVPHNWTSPFSQPFLLLQWWCKNGNVLSSAPGYAGITSITVYIERLRPPYLSTGDPEPGHTCRRRGCFAYVQETPGDSRCSMKDTRFLWQREFPCSTSDRYSTPWIWYFLTFSFYTDC